MTIEIKVPVLPESVADATVATWYKKPGDAVKRDENLVDIETDKVMLEVPAVEDGVMGEILQAEGQTVTAEQVLGTIEAGSAAAPAAEPAPAPSEPVSAEPAPTSTTQASASSNSDANMSPSVRRHVQAESIDLQNVTGSGKHGRILKSDLSESIITASTDRVEKRVPMTRLRARIAERLVQAQQNAAMLTTFNEVDLKQVSDLRKKFKDQFLEQHGVKLGFMSFFVKAAVEALKRYPAVNASIDGSDIIYHGYFDIGVAVSTERGLVVPVIRDADTMSLADIEKQIIEFGKKARDGKLTMEEMTGGTFTVSNGGVFGSLLSTPILNPPQSAIMGMHKIEQRPVVVDGEIVIRPMMYLAMSYDHRIIDGKDSVTFLKTIKELLEEPSRFLLSI